MKKFTKLFVAALCLVLLVGAIVGVSVTAAEEEEISYSNYDDFIVSANVSYSSKLQLYFAIDTTHTNFVTNTKNTTTNKTVTTYTDGVIDSIVCEIDGRTYNLTADEEKITISGDRPVYIVEAPGIAPKDILTEVKLTVKITGAKVSATTDGTTTTETARTTYHYTDTVTYSVAEYFYERLYKNDIINASTEAQLNQKELYLATLDYAKAAQELLAPEATKTLDDMIYVWGEQDLGLVKKGATVKATLENQYSFEYYDLNGITGSDVTKEAGSYRFDKHTKVEAAKETVTAPEGALTFDGFAEGAWTANTEGSVLLGYKGQAHPMYNVCVEKSSAANGNISSFVFDKYNTTRNGSANAMFWLVAQNNSGVDSATEELVFETRMRHDTASTPSIRFYDGRTAAHGENGSNIGEVSFSATALNSANMGISKGEWFTLRIVISGTSAKFYINGSSDPLTTFTLKASGCDAVQFTTSSTTFTKMEFEYMYFGTTPAADAVVVKPVGTLDYYARGYSDADVVNNVITSGASFENAGTDYTTKYGYTKVEEGNAYVSFEDTASSGQLNLRFANKNELDGEDNLTFSYKMRINPLASGENNYDAYGSGIDLRLRTASSVAKLNTAQVGIFVVEGKVVFGDHQGQKLNGELVETEIDASEWFCVSVVYNATNASSVVTVSQGELSYECPAIAGAGQGVAISDITNIAIMTMGPFKGILDIDDVSLSVSKAE